MRSGAVAVRGGRLVIIPKRQVDKTTKTMWFTQALSMPLDELGGRSILRIVRADMERRRTISFFLTKADEARLSSAIADRYPRVKFIDIEAWLLETPPTRGNLQDCNGSTVYIWNQALVPSLALAHAGGTWNERDGTQVAILRRSVLQGTELNLGQLALMFDDAIRERKQFAEGLIRVLRRQNAGPVRIVRLYDGETVERGVKRFVIGEEAYRRAAVEQPLTYAGHRYMPESAVDG